MPEPLSSQLSRTLVSSTIEADDEFGVVIFTSQSHEVIVSFTIEADDEFGHRVPHRTTRHGTTAGPAGDDRPPWLVSQLMWTMCMRFVPGDGVSVRSYARSAWWLSRDGISTTLRRMGGWWGYLTLDGAGGAGADRVIRPAAGGRIAREAWEPLTGQIEERWRSRFGAGQVDALCSALAGLAGQFGRPLPDCLRLYDVDLARRAPARPAVAGTLPGLLSQAIVQFELEFESEHRVPMPVCGNVLRVLGEGSMLVKDLAARTGLAKDGVEDGLRSLQRRKLVTMGPGPAPAVTASGPSPPRKGRSALRQDAGVFSRTYRKPGRTPAPPP